MRNNLLIDLFGIIENKDNLSVLNIAIKPKYFNPKNSIDLYVFLVMVFNRKGNQEKEENIEKSLTKFKSLNYFLRNKEKKGYLDFQ